jgi:hypothetical protein
MTTTFNISCEIDTTDASVPLDIAVFVDDQPIFDHACVDGAVRISHDLPEDDGNHELRFVMQHKQPEHTQIDEAGNIVKDARIVIRNIAFDDILLGQIMVEKATYTHSFNGSGETVTEKFYSEMGCNGTVSLKFSTPIYLWLLENM